MTLQVRFIFLHKLLFPVNQFLQDPDTLTGNISIYIIYQKGWRKRKEKGKKKKLQKMSVYQREKMLPDYKTQIHIGKGEHTTFPSSISLVENLPSIMQASSLPETATGKLVNSISSLATLKIKKK